MHRPVPPPFRLAACLPAYQARYSLASPPPVPPHTTCQVSVFLFCRIPFSFFSAHFVHIIRSCVVLHCADTCSPLGTTARQHSSHIPRSLLLRLCPTIVVIITLNDATTRLRLGQLPNTHTFDSPPARLPQTNYSTTREFGYCCAAYLVSELTLCPFFDAIAPPPLLSIAFPAQTRNCTFPDKLSLLPSAAPRHALRSRQHFVSRRCFLSSGLFRVPGYRSCTARSKIKNTFTFHRS